MPEWRNLQLPQRGAGGGGNVAEALQHRASAQRAGLPAACAVELDNCSLEAQKVARHYWMRGLCPRAPGIYRFRARMSLALGRLAPRPHSGSWVGAPVASLRCRYSGSEGETLRKGFSTVVAA